MDENKTSCAFIMIDYIMEYVSFFKIVDAVMQWTTYRSLTECGGKIGANFLILSLQYIDLAEPKSGAPVSVFFSHSSLWNSSALAVKEVIQGDLGTSPDWGGFSQLAKRTIIYFIECNW